MPSPTSPESHGMAYTCPHTGVCSCAGAAELPWPPASSEHLPPPSARPSLCIRSKLRTPKPKVRRPYRGTESIQHQGSCHYLTGLQHLPGAYEAFLPLWEGSITLAVTTALLMIKRHKESGSGTPQGRHSPRLRWWLCMGGSEASQAQCYRRGGTLGQAGAGRVCG